MTKNKGQFMPLIGALIGFLVLFIIATGAVIPVIIDELNLASATINHTELMVDSRNGTTLTLAYGDLVDGTFTATSCNGTSDPTFPVFLLSTGNYTLSLGSQNTKATVLWNPTLNMNISRANVSYDYYPSTYIKNRTVVNLIAMVAYLLLVALVVISATLIKF